MEQQGKPTLVIRQGRIKEQKFHTSKELLLLHNNNSKGDKSPLHLFNKPEIIKRLTPEQLKNRRRRERLANQHKVKSGPKIKKSVKVPANLRPYINLWQELGGSKHLNETTKTFRYGVKALGGLVNGKAFNNEFQEWKGRKFTFEEFERSLENFNLAAYSPNYYPQDKKYLRYTTLQNFILNKYTKTTESLFLTYLNKKPDRLDPLLTKLLIKYYREVTRNGDFRLTGPELKQFENAGGRLIDYFERNKNLIAPGFPLDRPRMVRWLFEAILADIKGFEDSKIKPGHLCSDITFNKRLPDFLTSQAIFRDRHTLL